MGRRRRFLRSADARTVVLTIVVAAVGGGLLALGLHWRPPTSHVHLYWWELAIAAIATNELGFRIQFRSEAHRYTLNELVLVLGCLLAAPWVVVVGRLLGDVAFGARRKRPRAKIAFNLANTLLESTVALCLVHVLLAGRPVVDWVSWPLTLVAVLATVAVSTTVVYVVIRWNGGRPPIATLLVVGTGLAVVDVNLGLLTAALLRVLPRATLLLVIVVAVTALAHRDYADLYRRYESAKLLSDGTAVEAGRGFDEVVSQVLVRARQVMASEIAELIVLPGPDGEQLVHRRDAPASLGDVLPLGNGATEEVLARLARDDHGLVVARTDRSAPDRDLKARLGVRELALAPLRSGSTVIGLLLVADRLPLFSAFNQRDAQLLQTLANHAAVALDNQRLFLRLDREAEERKHQALHDSLTDLPNRELFDQEVTEEACRPSRSAVLLVDINRFREVNDTLGHHNGDSLLRQVAARFAGALQPGDTVARLGGDEFAVLVRNIRNEAAVREVAARVVDALRAPFEIAGLSLEVTASVGIALAPDHGSVAGVLLQKADVAMYQAKDAHASWVVYSSARDPYSPRRLALANSLRQAIDEGHIVVHYQPMLRVPDGHVLGVEALVRWQHPELGLLAPDEFVPVAEQTELIVPLTNYVLQTALNQCAAWARAGRELGTAVNLAVRNLLDPKLPEQVAEVLDAASVPAGRLTLEITESSVMVDPSRAIAVLQRLAHAGVRLSVDDFGTGHSSLAYLERLPVHEVKVDKSFVLGMAAHTRDAMIVQSIIELGHNLGLCVVAEGVEDRPTWDRLGEMGCDMAQGFLMGRPAPAADLARLLASSSSLLPS
jgi:diguanylate cyclase (GGDEF)-like protein